LYGLRACKRIRRVYDRVLSAWAAAIRRAWGPETYKVRATLGLAQGFFRHMGCGAARLGLLRMSCVRFPQDLWALVIGST
jgi:hypothetical protein